MYKLIALSLSCLFFTVFCLIVQDSRAYYENGNYVKYLSSILEDSDFNIINQEQGESAWLVTQSGFHPSFHTEAITPIFGVAHIAENILLGFVPNSDFLRGKLGFILLNFVSLFGFFFFSIRSLRLLEIKVTTFDVFLFYFSSVVFYFSTFFMTVIDIISLPLISYVIYFYLQMRMKKSVATWGDWFVLGITFAFLSHIKFFNLILLVLFFEGPFKSLKFTKSAALVLLPIFAFHFLSALNRLVKFENLLSPIGSVTHYILASEFTEVLANLRDIFFSFHSLYFINLAYSLGILGLLRLGSCGRFNRKEHLTVLAILLCYMLWPMALYGGFSEDHFPGRIFSNMAPFIFIGYMYFFSRLSGIVKWPIQIIIVLLHLYFTASFILIDKQDSYAYPRKFYLSLDELTQGFEIWRIFLESNRSQVWQSLIVCVFASIVASFMVLSLLRKKQSFWLGLASILFVSYIGMTASNLSSYRRNVETMRVNNFYQGKSIASGPEAFTVDYMLDIFNFFKRNSSREQSELNSRIGIFFQKLKQQIKTEDEGVLNKLNSDDLSLSFWLIQNKSKQKIEK